MSRTTGTSVRQRNQGNGIYTAGDNPGGGCRVLEHVRQEQVSWQGR